MTDDTDQRPPPFTTADMDVRDLDSFMLNVERLMMSELVAISTGEEFKAAVLLWCRAWKQTPPGSLPKDERILASFSGAGPRWGRIRVIALHGFVECSDGRLYHAVLCEDVRRAAGKKQAFKNRASKGGNARWNRDRQCLEDASSMSQAPDKDASSMNQAVLNDAQGQYRDSTVQPVNNKLLFFTSSYLDPALRPNSEAEAAWFAKIMIEEPEEALKLGLMG